MILYWEVRKKYDPEIQYFSCKCRMLLIKYHSVAEKS